MVHELPEQEKLSPLEEKLLIALWQNRVFSCFTSGLAELVGGNLGNVHRDLSRLLQKGLIKRERQEADPKGPVFYTLTSDGERTGAKLANLHPDIKYGRCRPPRPRRKLAAPPSSPLSPTPPTIKERILQALPHTTGPRSARSWAIELGCSGARALIVLHELADEGHVTCLGRDAVNETILFDRVPKKLDD